MFGEENNIKNNSNSEKTVEKLLKNPDLIKDKINNSFLVLMLVLLVLTVVTVVVFVFLKNQPLSVIQQNALSLSSTDQLVNNNISQDQSNQDFSRVANELDGFEEKLKNFLPEKSVTQFTWQSFTGDVSADGKLIFEPLSVFGITYTMKTAKNAGINSQSDVIAFLENRGFYPSDANWDGMNVLGFQKDKIICLFLSDEYGAEPLSPGNITETLSCGELSEFDRVEFDTASALVDHIKDAFSKVNGEFKDLSGFSYYSLVDDQEKTISGVGITIEGQNAVEFANYLRMHGYLNQSWGAFDDPFSSGVGCSNGKISCQVTQIFSTRSDHTGEVHNSGEEVDQTSIVCTNEVVR